LQTTLCRRAVAPRLTQSVTRGQHQRSTAAPNEPTERPTRRPKAEQCFTDGVRTSGLGHSRRRVLGVTGVGLGAATLAGCGLLGDDPEPPEAPDPLQPLLDEAVALAAAYDRATVTQPGLAGRLTPLADDHRAHAAELARVIGAAPPSGPVTSASAGDQAPGGNEATEAVDDLRKAEQAAQKTATAACRQAPAERVALVGSIAACRATHAEALR
jgi:hypothetical protein